jgi:tRNA pseudouridine65 synthase
MDEMPILYLDERVCVLDKAPGVFVHSNPLDRSALDCLSYLRRRLGRFVYNVHRIDRPTSGVLLLAFDHDAASDLSRQIREERVRKSYLAMVRGHLLEPAEVAIPLPRSKTGETVEARSSVRPVSRAVFHGPVGKYDEGWFTLVDVDLHTGRYHQVRRHLRILGHPVIGDTTHGDPAQNHFFRDTLHESRLFLRSMMIEFELPGRDERVRIEAGLPDWWRRVIDALGFELPAAFPIDPRRELSPTQG